jgi:hypothetical protein
VDRALYSLPSRLIGRVVNALIYPETVRVFLDRTLVHEMPRLAPGAKKINYRHIAAHLLRKPGLCEVLDYPNKTFGW